MRKTTYSLVVLLLLASCSWTPDRDNPVDPLSTYYSAPPPPNTAPRIDTVRSLTHILTSLDDFLTLEVLCEAKDVDGNLRYDSVMVTMDTLPLGRMSYDAFRDEFAIVRTEVDFPPGIRWREDLDGDVIRVTVVDDSGALVQAHTVYDFPDENPPNIIWPLTFQDTAWTPDPVLKWHPWSHPSGPYTYSIRLDFMAETTVWDTSRLSAALDSVRVTKPLLDSREVSTWYYRWYVFVEDERGNTISSEAAEFKHFTR